MIECTKEDIKLVHRVAKYTYSKLPKFVELEELVSAGFIGLLDAKKKFKPEMNVEFKAYAWNRIYGSIVDYLRKEDILSRTQRKYVKDASKALFDTIEANGSVDAEAAAQALNVSLEKLNKMRLYTAAGRTTVKSETVLDTMEEENDELCMFADPADGPAELVLEQQRKTLIAQAIQELPERWRRIVDMIYYQDMTQLEVSKVLGVNESRVSQIHREIRKKLHTYLNGHTQSLGYNFNWA